MHFGLIPHCAYCEHFIFCFNVDFATEWGYCDVQNRKSRPSEEEIRKIEEALESGDYEILEYAKQLGLFVPSFETVCEMFSLSDESEFD